MKIRAVACEGHRFFYFNAHIIMYQDAKVLLNICGRNFEMTYFFCNFAHDMKRYENYILVICIILLIAACVFAVIM